jgi:7-cyano-7-deazaguanine synthase
MSAKAIILLSGGVDSATTLAIARQEGFELHALSFHYGQKNLLELRKAKAMAKSFGVKQHLVIRFSMSGIGGSALTTGKPVPKGRTDQDRSHGIPETYVPARNTIFLSFAVAWAETLPSQDIFIGVNEIDFSGYPDCRPAFIEAFEAASNLGTRIGTEGQGKIRIHAPLIHMKKSEIIKRGKALGIDFSMTSSCYDPGPDGRACGCCDSCLLRIKGFREAGHVDPIDYVIQKT